MRRHVETVGEQRHRASHIAGRYLAHHHDERERDDRFCAPGVFVMGAAQERVIVFAGRSVEMGVHGLYFE
jgi:hypothetical protein